MANYDQIVEGLKLLAICHKDKYGVDAEHDIIYAGPEISKVPEEINSKLEQLGWHHSDADRWAIYT